MTGPLQVLLTAGPLAFYFYLLAIWHGGRHPRVVSGPVDAGVLAFGIGGLLTFGPFGQLLAVMLFGTPGWIHWLAMASTMVLVGLVMARAAARRLVVYHIDPGVLDRAMEEVLDLRTDRYVRTFNGFEDRSHTRGLKVHAVSILGTAVIEAVGEDPEQLIQDVGTRLRARLERAATPSTAVASMLYSLSALILLIAMIGMFLTQPRAREALRGLIQRLQGG